MSWKKKSALGVLALFALVFLFLVEEHFRGKWELSRWKTQMAAKGEALTIGQVTAPLPAPRDNGMAALTAAGAQGFSFPWNLRPPAAAYAAEGKVVVITRLAAWRANGRRQGTNITWDMVAQALKPLEPALESAAEALKSPRFNSGVDYHAAWSTLLPHLARLRHLEWTLNASTLHRLHAGEIDQAVGLLLSAIRVPSSLEEEAFTVSQLVRMAMAKDALETTWQAIHVDGLNEAQLRQIQDAWAEQDFLKSMRRSTSMEHVLTSIEFERFRNSDASIEEWLHAWSSPAPPRPARASMFDGLEEAISRTPEYLRKVVQAPIWKFGWSHQDEVRYAQAVERALHAWDNAIAEQSAKPLECLGGAWEYRYLFEDEPDGRVWADFRYVMSPRARRFYPALRRAFATQTLRELAISAIALRRYELHNGKPPATLDQLIPEFLKEAPRDFMDGKPLRYKLTAAGPLLYSIGHNGKDDGGDISAAAVTGFDIFTGKDFVWPGEASPEEAKARLERGD